MAPRSLPLVGDLLAFGADRLGFLAALARDHGDVAPLRFGPYRGWLLTHPDQVHEVLVSQSDRFRKGPVLQRARVVLGDGLLTSESDTHRRHRRLVQPAFHSARITGYAETMIARADAVTRTWTAGTPIDLHAQTVRLTLASAGATLLGADVDDSDVATVERALGELLSAYKLAFIPFGWRLPRLPVGAPRRLRRGREALHGLVDRVVTQRRAAPADAGDLLSVLVHDESGDRLTDAEIRDHTVTLLLAGHETTANALAFAFYLLAGDPAIERRVHDEVDAVAEPGALPVPADVDRLPLCRAVVAEALRLYPPAWTMGREATADYEANGHAVRPGDLALLSQWVTHRDPRWWPEPDRFVPDRWLDSSEQHRPRWAYFPFGAGLRRCIGEGFAWTEAVLALATVARRWRLHLAPGRHLRLDPLITLRPRGGLWLTPESRQVADGADGGGR